MPTPPHDGVLAAFGVCIGVASAVGAAAGLLWAGIGGRIAMRIVFLTSGDEVRGLRSGDGFIIGRFSGATASLLMFTMILGGLAGLVVGIIRVITSGPTWALAVGTSLAAAAFGGASIVHTDSVDFTLLEPLWLSVGLFTLIAGLWGGIVVVVTDWLLARYTTGLVLHIRRRYWGAIGWVLLVGITAIGMEGLIADIAALT